MGDMDEPYGPRNQAVITSVVAGAGLIVCAWGAHGSHLDQDETVRGWLEGWGKPLMALGFTARGAPRHPLYLPADTQLVRMP